MAPGTEYQRICAAFPEDLRLLDTLIRSYIINPSLALSVTEFVLNPDAWRVGSRERVRDGDDAETSAALPEEPEKDEPSRKNFPAALEAHIRGMGLDEDWTEMMLQNLDPMNHPQRPQPQEKRSKRMKLNHCNHPTASIILLLSLCKNITTLYVTASLFGDNMTYRGSGGAPRSALQDYLLQSSYGLIPNPSLQKLERIEIIPSETVMSDDREYIILEFLDVFQYFHRLPNIHSFVMDGVGEYQSTQRPFFPRTSNTKVIHINHSDIPGALLCAIISAPKALEELKLESGGLMSTDGGSPQIFTKAIGTVLLEYRKSLKVLDLNLHASIDDDDDDDDEPVDRNKITSESMWTEEERERYGKERLRVDKESSLPSTVTQDDIDKRKSERAVCSFHDFTALTRLSIPIDALLGSPYAETDLSFRLMDTLPPTLEYLCLYDYTKGEDGQFDSHVDELMEKKADRFPKLVEVEGVETTVKNEWTADMDEDELWQRPEQYLDWMKVQDRALL